ncbi:MAG: AraC family transcriptional regulator [Flavobacteriaceae bacterium]|nr:AraC family transcriptional regulator [Flavobacteriaceae bacterium]
MNFSIVDVVSILIIYQAVIFISFLLFNKKSKPLFVKVLITTCLLISFHFLYMFFEKYSIENTYILGPFFGLVYGPLYYLYTKSLIVEKLSTIKYSIHFIPALLMLLLLVVFDTQSANFINSIGYVVTLHFIIYLLISLIQIFRYRKQLKNTTSSFYNISLFWLEVMIYIQFLTIAMMILESLFKSLSISVTFILIIYILALILINCFYYLGLKQVRLFKGFKVDDTNSVKEYSISTGLFNEYITQLTNHINSEKPYLEFDISLQDLSNVLSISTRNLSYVINKKFNRNFYDFINQYRLNIVKIDLEKSNKPIKEIMYDSGFSNKATFNAVFKKDTGLTPSQFRQKIKI